jgi:hypothetical protein
MDQIGGWELDGFWGEPFWGVRTMPRGIELLESIANYFKMNVPHPLTKKLPRQPAPVLPWIHADNRLYLRPWHTPIVREEDLREVHRSNRDEVANKIRQRSHGLCLIGDRVFVPTLGPGMVVTRFTPKRYLQDIQNHAVCVAEAVSLLLPPTAPEEFIEEIRRLINPRFTEYTAINGRDPRENNGGQSYEGTLPSSCFEECVRRLGIRIVYDGWNGALPDQDWNAMTLLKGLADVVEAETFELESCIAALEALNDHMEAMGPLRRYKLARGTNEDEAVAAFDANVILTKTIAERAIRYLPELDPEKNEEDVAPRM